MNLGSHCDSHHNFITDKTPLQMIKGGSHHIPRETILEQLCEQTVEESKNYFEHKHKEK